MILQHHLKRFGAQFLCFWMAIYGAPLAALEAAAQERQAAEAVQEAETAAEARAEREREARIAELRDEAQASSEVAPERAVPVPSPAAKVPGTHDEVEIPVEWTPLSSPLPPMPPSFGRMGSDTAGPVRGTTKNALDTLPFVAGWNLLSIPADPPNPAIDDVLAPIAGSYSRAWHYDACETSVEKWKVYDPADLPSSTSSSFESGSTNAWPSSVPRARSDCRARKVLPGSALSIAPQAALPPWQRLEVSPGEAPCRGPEGPSNQHGVFGERLPGGSPPGKHSATTRWLPVDRS